MNPLNYPFLDYPREPIILRGKCMNPRKTATICGSVIILLILTALLSGCGESVPISPIKEEEWGWGVRESDPIETPIFKLWQVKIRRSDGSLVTAHFLASDKNPVVQEKNEEQRVVFVWQGGCTLDPAYFVDGHRPAQQK